MTVLGILDCDELAPELKPDYKHYAHMFTQLLRPHCEPLSIRRYNVLLGEFPEVVAECDAYLVTGSKTGVYDNDPWLAPLHDFIRRAYEQGIALVGVCFGHQMLAHSLGGEAAKSDKGWGLGAYDCEATQDAMQWYPEAPKKLCLLYSHQDQVISLPPGAQRLYGNDFCPNAAYLIPQRVLAFQGHPEFTVDYSRRLMTLRQDRYAPGQYQEALNTLDKPLDAAWVAKTISHFIKTASDRKEKT
ncbi:MAG: hypothetical protein R3183_08630 [Oleiphilaceae bacterium]|nr:hypothetical protein [Oleiphilaceae bacterium]